MTFAPLLSELERAQLVREAGESDPAYLFKHALTQEAAYQSLLGKRRREIHRDVAEAYERLYPKQVDEFAALLAHHYAEAGDDARALGYYQRAAERAARLYANREAMTYYERALAAAVRLEAPLAPLLHARGQVYERLGNFPAAQSDYQRALDEARSRRRAHDEWQALIDLGFLWQSRDYARTGEYFRRALERARTMDDPLTLAVSLNRLGNWYGNVEQPHNGAVLHDEALAIYRQHNDRRGLADTLDLLGMNYLLQGDSTLSRHFNAEAVKLFEELDDRIGLVSNLATTAFWDAAAGERAVKLAGEVGWRSGEAYALIAWGSMLTAQGDFERGMRAAREGLQIAEEIGHVQWMTVGYCEIGVMYLELRALFRSQEILQEALAWAHQMDSQLWVRAVSARLARAYFLQGEFERAQKVLDAARGSAVRPDTASLQLVWLAYAELELERAKPDGALGWLDALPDPVANTFADFPQLHAAMLRGRTLTALERAADAELVLHRALTEARAENAVLRQWELHAALAELYGKMGRADEADGEAGAASELIGRISSGIPDPTLRRNFERCSKALVIKLRG